MADHSIQRPVPIEELDEHFKPRKALKETPIALERRFHVTAEREPQVKTRLQRIERGDGQPHWEVIVDMMESVLAVERCPRRLEVEQARSKNAV